MMTASKKTVVYYDAPLARSAPRTETGLLGWMRNNLLRSWSDVVLTAIFAIVVSASIYAFFSWAIQSGNWLAITFNFRQYMIGSYEPDLEWRIVAVVLIASFVAGLALAVWVRRLARIALTLFVVILLLMWLIPPIVYSTIPIPAVYVAAGSAPVNVGNVTDAAKPLLAFIGKANETVRIQVAPLATDEAVASLTGFMDSATNGMRFIASKRLTDIQTVASMEAQLTANAASDIPILTANQAAKLQSDLAALVPIPPVTETLSLGQADVRVVLLDGATGEPIGEAQTLPSSNEVATFTLPADGWYILDSSTPDDDNGLAVLAVSGIQPILQTNSVRPGGGFVANYQRMVDSFAVTQDLPQVEGKDVPFFDIFRNQYWGNHSFSTYLRVYLSPFLERHALNATLLFAAGVLGYWTIVAVRRARGERTASRVASAGLLLWLSVFWVLTSGLAVAEIVNFTIVVGAIFAVMLARAIGAYWGRTYLSLFVMMGVVLLTMSTPYGVFAPHYGFGILPVFNLVVFVPAFIAWLYGSDTYGFADPRETSRELGLYAALTLTFLFVPRLLVATGILSVTAEYPDWFLRPSDQKLWGGLLLTFILTIYGIVVSFPIGILLALGRRSNLPAVKVGCTLFIEFIRGVPFITVLFFGQLFIPLINPQFANVPGTIRMLVATIIFSAAYLAENIRGGLQSLPPGQTEAGKALGLSGWQINYYITLPQALRAVIPALLGSFIALFKDTSLVAIVGLTDLTGFVQVMTAQTAFSGTRLEGLVFITIIYFVFSYVMSYVSRLLEASGSGAVRRI
jgi:His/Glu/Gln/Arg/opine family amino acid ABC transporter permease subunit